MEVKPNVPVIPDISAAISATASVMQQEFSDEPVTPNQPLKRGNTKITRKTFMTRADFMENIQIPKSSENRVIIPSNSAGNGFLKTCYEDAFLNNFISKLEFDQIVETISKKTELCYSQRRKDDASHAISNNTAFGFWFSGISTVLFLWLFYNAANSEHNASLMYVSYACGALAALNLMYMLVRYTFKGLNHYPTFESMVKESLECYFDTINKKMIERGLMWRVVPGHYWVELRIDSDLKEDILRFEQLKRETGSNHFIIGNDRGTNANAVIIENPSQNNEYFSQNSRRRVPSTVLSTKTAANMLSNENHEALRRKASKVTPYPEVQVYSPKEENSGVEWNINNEKQDMGPPAQKNSSNDLDQMIDKFYDGTIDTETRMVTQEPEELQHSRKYLKPSSNAKERSMIKQQTLSQKRTDRMISYKKNNNTQGPIQSDGNSPNQTNVQFTDEGGEDDEDRHTEKRGWNNK